MSENKMLTGFVCKIPGEVSEDEIDNLYESFNADKYNIWQPWIDEDDTNILAMITDSEDEFYDSFNQDISMQDIAQALTSLYKYIEENDIELKIPDMHLFTKIWYDGCEMGTLFNKEKV